MRAILNFLRFTVLTLGLALPASAGDPAGWWTSSTGTQIQIWANMQQVVLTFHSSSGVIKINGQWTRFSDYFAYSSNGVTYNCAFTGPNQISVSASNGATHTWTRGRQNVQPQPQPQQSSINGLWASSSGSSVQLSTQGQQVFVTIIGSNGSRVQGSGRWTQYPYRFDYSLPGYPGVANCALMNNGQIQVNYQGQVTTWSRR